MSKRPLKRAFTLIELLIVVAIIGILAAIAVPNFLSAQIRAKVAKAYSDIRSIVTAQEMYALDNAGGYPPESEDMIFNGKRGRMESGLFWLTTPMAYMTAMPSDPFMQPNWPLHSGTSIRAYETGVKQRGPKFVAYVVFTIGPDLGENGVESANPFTGAQRGGYGNTYASSNGLKSRGDIFWYGGDCSVTRSLVLDGRIYNGTCPPSFRN